MSAILYNTNSSLIPKFQKYRQHRELPGVAKSGSRPGTASDVLDLDLPFESIHDKNSDPYLQELCCSVYPELLHQRVCKLSPAVDLPVHAFMCLIWKNFVTSWYGVKIPTSDDKFMVQLFELVEEIVSRMKKVDFRYESFLTEDLPLLLSQHIRTMRIFLREDDVFRRYCQLTSYEEGYYPQTLTNYILSSVRCESTLQTSFLQALFNNLLLGKVLDKITEPYFVVAAIDKICEVRGTRPAKNGFKQWSFQDFKSSIAKVGKTIALMTSMNKNSKTKLSRPFPYIGAFSLFVDILKLPERKPFLYAFGKTVQYWSAKSKSLNAIMQNLFFNILSRFFKKNDTRTVFVSLRSMLFPNDNKLGPGKEIPVGGEFRKFVDASIEKQWQSIRSRWVNQVLGIDRSGIQELNEVLIKDKRCNKLLVIRILDCLLAQTNTEAA